MCMENNWPNFATISIGSLINPTQQSLSVHSL